MIQVSIPGRSTFSTLMVSMHPTCCNLTVLIVLYSIAVNQQMVRARPPSQITRPFVNPGPPVCRMRAESHASSGLMLSSCLMHTLWLSTCEMQCAVQFHRPEQAALSQHTDTDVPAQSSCVM